MTFNSKVVCNFKNEKLIFYETKSFAFNIFTGLFAKEKTVMDNMETDKAPGSQSNVRFTVYLVFAYMVVKYLPIFTMARHEEHWPIFYSGHIYIGEN